MSAPATWSVTGQGLAGTCLAWHLWWRKIPFTLTDDDRGGSSRVAAGLINPITGKNFEPSRDLDRFHSEALSFYQKVESELGARVWHPLPLVRLASSADEWSKIESKLDRSDVAPWIEVARMNPGPSWFGAVRLRGAGRLDTRMFLDRSRDFFRDAGHWVSPDECPGTKVWCDGAAGLMAGRLGSHRCAKGEILTLQAPGWPEDHIRIGAGGWLVPIGGATFKAGATYTWDPLDAEPTADGRTHVEEIARRLGQDDIFTVIAHDAGIRPIIRRSEPLIGPLDDGSWSFNGLGSKGSLHAPATSRMLVDWWQRGTPPPPHYDLRCFPTRS